MDGAEIMKEVERVKQSTKTIHLLNELLKTKLDSNQHYLLSEIIKSYGKEWE